MGRHFSPEGAASRAVYGKGTDESLAPRKMKFQVLPLLSLSPSSPPLLLPFPSNASQRGRTVSGIVYADEKFHARRGNKRLNFSRGVVRLFN